MPKRFKTYTDHGGLERMFETRSEAWDAVGLSLEINERTVRRARRELLVLTPILIAVIIGQQWIVDYKVVIVHHHHGFDWQNLHTPATVIAVLVVLSFGWLISRDVARIAPTLFKRMDPGTAGTVGFLVRFIAVAATILGALAVAGIDPQTLAVGGAFTAVVLGLAAQQTLGNVFAGMVLLSARPFRLGELVRLQAGAVGGNVEGVVSSLGLLYTTLARGEDRIMIPNNVVLAAVVVPLREPEAVDVKVTLASGIRVGHAQAILDDTISIPTRAPGATVLLEEIDGDELVVRVQATPENAEQSADLADEIISALANFTGEHEKTGSSSPS
jgi:small conductance mechanosensitive channel